MKYFKELPKHPEQISGTTVLQRMVDGLGFRYRVAVTGLSKEQLSFQPTKDNWNLGQLLHHIYRLCVWTSKSFKLDFEVQHEFAEVEEYEEATLALLTELSKHLAAMTEDELAKVEIHLKRTDSHMPFWYIINGPLADALTHVGQIVSWRRMAGNPVTRVSGFTGIAY